MRWILEKYGEAVIPMARPRDAVTVEILGMTDKLLEVCLGYTGNEDILEELETAQLALREAIEIKVQADPELAAYIRARDGNNPFCEGQNARVKDTDPKVKL